MKNKLKLLWLIAVIGLVVMACDNGTGGGNGNGGTTTPDPCANGHSFTEWKETTAATCLDAAINTEKCDVCGTLGEETDEGHHAIGHSAGETGGAIEATCEDDGYTGTGNCIRCSIELKGEVIDAFEHHYHDWTEPTCTTDGNNKRECTNDCGTISTRTEGYAALGHNWNSASGAIECDRDRDDCTLTLAQYIQNSAHTGTAADPVPLKVSIDLGAMGTADNGWTQLLAALNTGNKLVALDLSGSTRSSDGAFTTGSASNTAAPGLTGLSQIVSLILPSTTVTSISNYAFRNCMNLTSITIPNSVKSIGDYAFYNTGLTSVTIPNSVTSIGGGAFYSCSNLMNITIPKSVTSIGTGAFYVCSKLTSVTIPDSVMSISQNLFYGCTAMADITIGSGVASIGTWAFRGCTALVNITVDAANPNLASEDGIIYNKNMTILIAFPSANGNIAIPDSVESIADGAFSYNSNLTSVTIPDSVMNIGSLAFSNCSRLASVTVLALTPPTLGLGVFDSNQTNRIIYVPADSIEAYKAATRWSTYASVIQAIEE